MRKFIVALAAMGLVVGSASAQLSGVGNGAVNHNEASQWYSLGSTWAQGLGGAFNGHDFGVVSTLTLGGYVETWGGGNSGQTTEMRWSVNGGAESSLNLPYLDSAGENGNDRWQNLVGVNVASGQGVGDHTVTIFFRSEADNTSGNWINGTSGTADFSIVPEPSTLLLGAVGLVGLVIARRRMA